jgi:NTP pyrophosphatase (non-canonical NTP hydrolase)
MDLDDYQAKTAATDAVDVFGGGDPLVALLGLGSHVGALLDAHKRYLRSSVDLRGATELISREVGDLLWYVSVVAQRHGLTLSEIARHNLDKVRERSAARGGAVVPDLPAGPVTCKSYQAHAAYADENPDAGDPLTLSVPLLGLAGEAGSLLNAQKKYYTDQNTLTRDRGFVRTELGDLLWYLAAVASHCELSLADIATSNLAAAARYDATRTGTPLPTDLPVLDADFPDTERFPRRMTIRFQPVTSAAGAPRRAKMTLIAALPNSFPDGPVEVGRTASGRAKMQGFAVGQQLGDHLTDNSSRDDGYRFHDAIHLGFLAVLGWSPTLRGLLRVKRRSDHAVDENEDGARAVFAEEGMAAVLAKRAVSRLGFRSERSVDNDSIDIVTTVLEDLEVARLPPWLWRRAVSQGFDVMQQLADNRGSGYVIVDLDARTVLYSRTPPSAP